MNIWSKQNVRSVRYWDRSFVEQVLFIYADATCLLVFLAARVAMPVLTRVMPVITLKYILRGYYCYVTCAYIIIQKFEAVCLGWNRHF